LYNECYERVRNFPKLDKHLLGEEILKFINETHKAALLSIYNPQYIINLSANFDLVKKSLRTAINKKLISDGWWASQLELITHIGQEIGSWLKKTKNPKF
jgi:hypothetical protein